MYSVYVHLVVIRVIWAGAVFYEALHQADLIQMLPEFHKIMKIFAVIPATTCTAERSFSDLRRMKT